MKLWFGCGITQLRARVICFRSSLYSSSYKLQQISPVLHHVLGRFLDHNKQQSNIVKLYVVTETSERKECHGACSFFVLLLTTVKVSISRASSALCCSAGQLPPPRRGLHHHHHHQSPRSPPPSPLSLQSARIVFIFEDSAAIRILSSNKNSFNPIYCTLRSG